MVLFCVDLYKVELEAKLTELLATPVKIGHLRAHLRRGLKPELVLKDISLQATNAEAKPNLELQEIRLGIDLLAVITQQQIIPATWITLVGAKLSVIHKADGSFAILGLQGGDGQPAWLLEGRHYELLQSEITWLDEKNHRPARTFTQVDISIKNNLPNQHHQLNMLSHLPRAYGDTLRISTDFSGDFFTPNALNAQLFVAGKNIHFAHLIPEDLPLKLVLKAGSGDFELWGTVQNSQLTALSGQINSNNLSLQRPDRKKLQLSNLSSRFDWRNQVNSWRLAVDDLTIALPDKIYPLAQFYLGSLNKTTQQFNANIKSLDLEAVQTIGAFLGKDLPGFQNLKGLKMKGQFSNTLIFADLKQQHFNINGKFAHLSLAMPAPYPQLQNLSGTMDGNEQYGVLSLNSQNSQLIAQPMFRAPLAITHLAGQLHWQQEQKNWLLSAANLKLNTPYAQSSNNLKVKIPKDSQPIFIDLQTAFFNLNDVSNAKVYFPVTLMSQELLHYLDEAFIKGQVKRGDMVLYGYLQDFPFIKHEGVFQVLFDADDVTMKYAEGWPFFEHLDARVLFENDSLEVNVKQAKVETQNFASLQINGAKISIPSFSDSDYVFVKEALANAEINAGLNFLQHTPLPLPLKSVSEQLAITGDTKITLDLKIPLTDKVMPKVEGSASVSGAKLNVLAINLPINNLTGMFRFTQDGFYSDTLQAIGLGYPLQAKVSLKPDSTLISIAGKTGIKDLAQQFNFPAQDTVHGASDYTVQLLLPFAEKSPPQLSIRSDLQGISLALPDTLAKTATEQKELELKFNLIDSPILPISLNYDQKLKANLWLNKADKKILAGNVLLGKGESEPAEAGKFKVKLNQAHFSPLPWFSVLSKIENGDDKAQLLTDLEIHTPQLDWAGQQLGLFDLKLQHHADDWSGTLNCAAAKGRLQIPDNRETNRKIKLDMEQIDLSSLMQLSLPKATSSLRTKLPLFEINAQNLWLRGINLGKLEWDTERYANGIKFKNFTVTAKEHRLSLNGDWQWLNNQEITHLNGQLVAENLGGLLEKLKLNEDIKETEAVINLALHWSGAPYQFSLTTLSGTMDLKLTDGRISSIEPGFGRLLGVLAVEQWLKRLQLDFGDIYKEGLSFNDITGHFNLSNGTATTDDLTVDAVPATINLTGELNLPEQTMDQHISVIPKSSDAVPIAGTIVGGIATVVTQTLTGEYEAGYYLRSKYQVKGKWNNLNIIPLHEQDGLLKKTWQGLTDFSWITHPEQD
jgi:uncharacterized protein (TIGR02099 family)